MAHDHSKCIFSTGICGSITVGQGRLDDYGYWQYPCPDEAIHAARIDARVAELNEPASPLQSIQKFLELEKIGD